MLELTLVIAVILLLSGFFSGAEASLVSISSAEVEEMVGHKRFGAKVLASVHHRLSRSVIAIVVLNNVVNIVGSILVGRIVISMYGDALLGVTTTGLTFGVIIFSEIIPKTLGMHYAQKVCIPIAFVIRGLTLLLLPFILLLEQLTNVLKRGERKIGTEEQIRSLVTIGRRRGHIESDEGQLIHRAFILNDKSAADIMTPLKDIISVTAEDTIGAVWQKIDHEPHSRYPIFAGAVHDVPGMVIKQDVLQALYEKRGGEPILSIMRETLIVRSSVRSDELIGLFRDRSTHLAVVQEDGKTVGLVTLEDVLEELIGEIEDETDVEV